MDESELDSMLSEVGGGCTFDNMVKMFQEKMAGGSNDPDDLIVRAFKAYELEGGKIEAEMFRHALMNFGDKFSKAEIDDIFGEFEVDDDGFLESKAVIGLFVAGGGEKRRKKRRRKKLLQQQKQHPLKEAKREARRKRRRRRPPSKLDLPRYTFIFSNFLNSNLYVKCLYYIPSSFLVISFLDKHLF